MKQQQKEKKKKRLDGKWKRHGKTNMQSIKAFRDEIRATKHRMAYCLLKV